MICMSVRTRNDSVVCSPVFPLVITRELLVGPRISTPRGERGGGRHFFARIEPN